MQYLAMIRCTSDDIPIGLYPSRANARGALRSCTADRLEKIANLLGLDPGVFIGGTIVTFDGPDIVRIDIDAPVSKAAQSVCEQPCQ